MWFQRVKSPYIKILAVPLGLFLLFLCIPVPKFDDPYSTVLTAQGGELLGARIADDGQWRFPASNNYSAKYTACVLEYEDHQFFRHIGVNPVSFIQALIENLKAGKVVRGGSTISMQVVRLARKNKPRTYSEKLLEVVLALRLELRYSKQTILDLYAAHAPFGGNVVGIDAAAWRYCHTTPDRLTWSEAATLAVLPNAPSMIHPGKARERLQEKRDDLLLRLTHSKVRSPRRFHIPKLSGEDYELALMERLPDKPYDMPQLAYHYLMDQEKSHKGEQIHSSLDYHLQQRVTEIMERHYQANTQNQIENAAVLVVDHLSQEIIAYVGNNPQAKDAAMVDMVKAQRSTGSILKPFLFAAMLDEGTLLPTMMLPDVPMSLSGFTPKNYSGQYWGAVPANVALQHSLNAPFVYLLKDYGHQRFHALLKRLELSGIVFDSDLARHNESKYNIRSNYAIKYEPQKVPGTLVRDFRIETRDASGAWSTLAHVTDNHRRLVRVPVGRAVRAVRLVPEQLWGDRPFCRLFAFDCR